MLFAGIFLISSAALGFQIALTRIFSISEWYHLAFMVISLALLGFGASGSFLSVFPSWLTGNPRSRLAVLASLFSLTSLLSFIIADRIPFDSFRMGIERVQILYLALLYLSLSTPFFLAGLLIGISLIRFAERAHLVYFWNLLGSGAGCFLVLLIPLLGGVDRIPALTAYLGLAGAFMFVISERRHLPLAFFCITACLIVIITFTGGSWLKITLSPYKSLSLAVRSEGGRILSTRENAVSRVDIIESPVVKYAPGLSYMFDGILPAQLGMAVDGENITGITVLGERDDLAFTEYLPGAVGYGLARGGRILVIEPHGGLDVLSALHHGAGSVTVVEGNPLLINMIKEGCAAFTREPYWNKKVEIVTENARAYIRRTDERFDLVTVSLSGDFGAVMSGAFSLREEHLYTVEAIKGYLNILSPNGVLLLTRWLQTPPSECVRLGVTVISALEEMGFANPSEQLAFIRGWMTGTVIVKRKPYESHELSGIREFCRKMKFDVVWLPDIREDELNRYNRFPEPCHYNVMRKVLREKGRDEFLSNYEYDISPVRDNRPFFFHFFKWKQTPSILASLGRRWLPYAGGGYLMVMLLSVIAVLSCLLLIMAPLFILHRGRAKGKAPLKNLTFFAYFFSLGMGFLFLEISFMHYFILFIGEPTYAFAVVLAAILVFSSVGSLLSGRVRKPASLEAILLGLCICALLYGLFLQRFFLSFIGQNSAVRIVLSLGILLPVGVLMGFPFPLGLKIVRRTEPVLLPWVWGINGCASVVASILAMLTSISRGYNWVIIGGSLFYFTALVALRRLR